jgi:hypothetical protein
VPSRWQIMGNRSVEILTTEEADVLRAIVQGSRHPDLGAAALIRLNHLRLIMSPGVYGFLPTALGIAWCRTYPRGQEPNGSKEEGRSQDSRA